MGNNDKNKDFFDDNNNTNYNDNRQQDLYTSSSSNEDNKRNVLNKIKESITPKNKYPFSAKEIILGIALLVFLITSIVLAFLFASRGKQIGALICAGVFVLTAVVTAIIVSSKERRALKRPRSNYTVKRALVVGCTISSQTTVLNKVTIKYKVKLEIDGDEVETYSLRECSKGDVVQVFVRGNSNKYCYINWDNY